MRCKLLRHLCNHVALGRAMLYFKVPYASCKKNCTFHPIACESVIPLIVSASLILDCYGGVAHRVDDQKVYAFATICTVKKISLTLADAFSSRLNKASHSDFCEKSESRVLILQVFFNGMKDLLECFFVDRFSAPKRILTNNPELVFWNAHIVWPCSLLGSAIWRGVLV